MLELHTLGVSASVRYSRSSTVKFERTDRDLSGFEVRLDQSETPATPESRGQREFREQAVRAVQLVLLELPERLVYKDKLERSVMLELLERKAREVLSDQGAKMVYKVRYSAS